MSEQSTQDLELYDVILLLADEDREVVRQIANELLKRDVKVFFDEFEKHKLWGKDAGAEQANIYHSKARYHVVFISKHYNSFWNNYQQYLLQAKTSNNNKDYILPVRLDNTELKSLFPTTAYLDIATEGINGIVEAIYKKCHPSNQSVIANESTIVFRQAPTVDVVLRLNIAYLDKDKTANLINLIAGLADIGVEEIQIVDINEDK